MPPFINMWKMFRQDLIRLEVFRGMNQKQLSLLLPMVEHILLSKDLTIFSQGQTARHFYILLSGEVVIIHKPYDGTELTVARIQSGGIFGWSAALGKETYTSEAVAVVESEAYRLNRQQLQQFCRKNPDTGEFFLERLAKALGDRLPITPSQILSMLKNGMDMDG